MLETASKTFNHIIKSLNLNVNVYGTHYNITCSISQTVYNWCMMCFWLLSITISVCVCGHMHWTEWRLDCIISAGLNATHCCSEPPTEKLECLYHGTTFTDKIMVQMSKTCILINICVCVKFHGSGMQWKHVMNQKRDTVVGLIFFDK